MAWTDLKQDVLAEFAEAQSLAPDRFRDHEGVHYRGLDGATRWQAIKANPGELKAWREQNARAARRYLAKPGNRERHNARQRAYDRARAQRSAEGAPARGQARVADTR